MRRGLLLTDILCAVAIALLVMIVSPGVAVTAILAVLALVICAVTALFGRVVTSARSRERGAAARSRRQARR
jgi:hypothetical protein